MNKREEKKFYKHVGARMKARRRELKLTQEKVAKKLRMTRENLVAIEQGRQGTGLHNYWLIAEILDVSVVYFFPNPIPKP